MSKILKNGKLGDVFVMVEELLGRLPLECSGGVAVSGRWWVSVGDGIMIQSGVILIQDDLKEPAML